MIALADVLASLERLFEILTTASIAGIFVTLAVWPICRLARTLTPSARCALWWLAALKLVVALVWVEPVVLRVLPERTLTPAVLLTSNTAVAADAPSLFADPEQPATLPSWRAVVAGLWILGVVVAMATMIRQLRRMADVRARAAQVDPRVRRAIAQLSALVGLSKAPDARVSDAVDAPMVVGIFRPMILLPASRFNALSLTEQNMALCHELVHLRRRDLLLGCVPALAERLFFFHPLAHLAAREYLVAREAACDREVIRLLNAAPHDYGRLLLTLGVTPLRAGFAAAGTPQSFSDLKRRIAMLGHRSPTGVTRLGGWMLSAVAACALVPIQLAARPSAALPEANPSKHVASLSVAARTEASTASQPGTPEAQKSRPRLDYVLISNGDHGTTMSGSWSDGRNVERLRRGNERLLWFRHNGKEYVVRDAAALDEAERINRPMAEIGAKQGAIGAQQGAIGAKQGEVGAKQGEIGARQGAIGAKQGAIGAQQAALATRELRSLSESEGRELEQERKRLDEEMRDLGREMEKLGEEMERAGQPMEDFDAEMRKLSAEMDGLSGQMEEASAKANEEMLALVERLIATSVAHPAP